MRTLKENETTEKAVAIAFIFFLFGPVVLLIIEELFIEIQLSKQYQPFISLIQVAGGLLCIYGLHRLGTIKKLARILDDKK